MNARWLAASILTGMTGALLLGAAIFVSSEGEITFAALPERAVGGGARTGDDNRAAKHKDDKLVRAEVSASAKQVFKAPMTLRTADREVIKVRSFVRLAAGLSLTSGVYATNIPPFNPLRFFSDAGSDRSIELGPEPSDADVSVVKSDLSAIVVDASAPALGDAEVLALIRAGRPSQAASRTASPELPSPLTFGTSFGSEPRAGGSALFPRVIDTPFKSLEIRVVPENVTAIAKTARDADGNFAEKVVPLARGDAIEAVLRANGTSVDDAREIAALIANRDRAVAGDGQQLRILQAPVARVGEPRRTVRAVIVKETGIDAIAALNDRGRFVSVAPPPSETAASQSGVSPRRTDDEDEGDDDEGSGAPLYDSLYETALKHDIPRQTVDDLVRIFGYDVDFQRRVTSKDSIDLFCAADEENGDRLEILSATLTTGSDVRRVFRYQADDGSVDYFDEAGRSLKKFLIRKPVVEARLSSGFGARYHPILGYAKMHTGVDWAAKTGTPIMAAGNGTVIKAEWSSGYGRRTEVQHANGYVTAYNHQNAFGRGIAPGARVRQGQIIGFVGSTGLSTGAHLHFEVLVNGHFVDPMKIRVPRGRELDGRALADFGRQREEIQAILRKGGPNRLAQSDAR